MKPKNSPLTISDIYIIAGSLLSIPAPDGFTGQLNSFDVEMDFNIFQHQENENQFKIRVKVDGNDPDNPVPGYCFNVIAEGIFIFAKESSINKAEKDSLISRSAIPIVIGHIRSYLLNLTAAGPYEKYLFPIIDFNDILNQKLGNSKSEKIE
jgi:preprotein translocase subunit SecB